jgi:hypothetical protein
MERQMPDYHRIPFRLEFAIVMAPLLGFSAFLLYAVVRL